MERVEPGAGQMEAGGLDDVLMRDDDHVAVRVLGVEPPGHGRHPLGHVADLLVDEPESGGMFQVCLELAGES